MYVSYLPLSSLLGLPFYIMKCIIPLLLVIHKMAVYVKYILRSLFYELVLGIMYYFFTTRCLLCSSRFFRSYLTNYHQMALSYGDFIQV